MASVVVDGEGGGAKVQISRSGSVTIQAASSQLENALRSRPAYSELQQNNIVPSATAKRAAASSRVAAAAAALQKAQQKVCGLRGSGVEWSIGRSASGRVGSGSCRIDAVLLALLIAVN